MRVKKKKVSKRLYQKNDILRSRPLLLLFVVIIASIGIYFLTGSHAQSPYVAAEAESGALSSGASKIADTNASGGNAVQFGTKPTSGSNIPAQPAIGWPSGFGSGRVVMADDFNGSTLSNLWGEGLAADGCGLADHGTKQAEYPGLDKGAIALYTPANVLLGDANGNPSHLILKAQYQSAAINAAGCGLTTNYTSGAINTVPANFNGDGSGDGYAPSTGGFAWQEGKTDLIIQFKGSMPGINNTENYLWYGAWASSVPQWQFETDFNETAYLDSNGGRQPGSATHYCTPGNTGSCAGNNSKSSGGWGSDTNPAPGTEHVYTIWEHADGSFQVYMDGVQKASLPAENTNNNWMSFIVQYGISNPPRNYYPNWTSDELTMDYIVAWQPASLPVGTGIYHGGIAPGTTVP